MSGVAILCGCQDEYDKIYKGLGRCAEMLCSFFRGSKHNDLMPSRETVPKFQASGAEA